VSANRRLEGFFDSYSVDTPKSHSWRYLGTNCYAISIVIRIKESLRQTVLRVDSAKSSILQRLSDLSFGNKLFGLATSNALQPTVY
jgi:hypothetical protein